MAKKKHMKTDEKTDERTRSGKAINVWIDSHLWEALRVYLLSQRPKPSTTSVVETALEDFLRARGYYPPPEVVED